MTSKIYIASKMLDGPAYLSFKQHLYLVYDADGDASTTGDQSILRAGPESSTTVGQITIEPGFSFSGSADKFDSGSYVDRNYTVLTDVDADAKWAEMLDAASALAGPEDLDHKIHTTIDYSPLGPNSNSFVATILYQTGYDIVDSTPQYGALPVQRPLGTFTGWNAFLGTDGNDTWNVDLSQPVSRIVFDQGGNDTYVIDVSAPRNGSLTIEEVAETGSNNVLTLQNVDAGDVSIYRTADGKGLIVIADGEVVSLIPGQFENANPQLANVHIVPTVGSPTDIPVDDPDDIPFFHDRPLPADVLDDIQPAFGNAITAASPLVIDLSSGHTGVTLTAWNASTTETFFDLNASGFAVQTAWVSGDTGLLARDLNSNGTIDSSAELFGSPTVDGFAKLAALDSNHDLRIDNNDSAWSSLVVWTDDNGDAVTQSGELHSLASLGIANIDLAGVASSTSTISGNPISHTSTVTFTGGATATIADAWFIHDNTNSYFVGDYTLDTETLFLPALRGYGKLPDLTIAMSQDSDLKDLVSDFAANFSLSDLADVNLAITDILYKWAGVEEVDPASRGYNIDARHLEFLEHMLGTDFVQNSWLGFVENPLPHAAVQLEEAFQAALKMFSTDLLIQIGIGDLFDTPISYDAATGVPAGDFSLSETAIGDLASTAPATGPENEAFWVALAGVLDEIKGLENLTVDEKDWLDDAVTTSNALLDWSAVLNTYANENGTSSTNGTSGADTLYGGTTDDTIHGLVGNDTIYGSFGNDMIYGDDGDNVLYGDEGDDYVAGGSGNDLLYGGDGNDDLHGGYGNDTYYAGAGGNTIDSRTGNDTFVYGGGDDVITEYGGTDQIVLPSGVVLGDLSFSRVSSDNSTSYFDDLLIQIDGAGSIQIRSQFYNSYTAVETIVFSDTSTLSLSSLAPDVLLTGGNDNFSASTNASYTVYGFNGNDTISAAGTGAHTIDGGNGNDALSGGSGSNDTYIASAGFDTITESGGTDTIVVSAEYDASDVSFYRIGTYDLGILINGLGQIKINSQLSWLSGVENLHFLSDNSNIDLTSLSIATLGTAGNDTLYVPAYSTNLNDFIDGREGNDSLNGDSGNDTYVFSAGHDTIYETSGSDTIRVLDSYTPSDVSMFFDADNSLQLIDSDGNNMTVYRQAYSSGYGVEYVTFADSTTWNLGSMEIETHGTSGNDSLYGAAYGDASTADIIYSYAGADYIYGGSGNDLLYGGDGNDNLRGEAGNDTLNGGDGNDYFYASSGDGNDIAHGDAGADDMYGADHSVLYGDEGNDTLYNSATWPYAATTSVQLYGGAGADTLWGGYGETIMDGGSSADSLNGVSGSTETFKFGSDAFGSVDTVNQFRTNDNDKLDIADILDGYYDSGTDVITDFVQITTNGSNSELYVDISGSATFGAAQHIATIQSVTGFTDEEALVTAGVLLAA